MDEKTIITYNKKAVQYKKETDDFWQRFPSGFMDTFIKELSGKKVLDIGSGPGRDAEIFRKASLNVVCMDASESMVNLTRKMGFESVVGNFTNIPFESEAFDGVWSYTSLLHIHKNDIKEALKEIHRVMKKGSFFGLGLIEGKGEEERFSMGEEYPRLFSYFKKEEIETLARQLNMEGVYFEKHPVNSKIYLHFIFKKV